MSEQSPEPLKVDVPEYDHVERAGVFSDEGIFLFGMLAMFALGMFVGVMMS